MLPSSQGCFEDWNERIDCQCLAEFIVFSMLLVLGLSVYLSIYPPIYLLSNLLAVPPLPHLPSSAPLSSPPYHHGYSYARLAAPGLFYMHIDIEGQSRRRSWVGRGTRAFDPRHHHLQLCFLGHDTNFLSLLFFFLSLNVNAYITCINEITWRRALELPGRGSLPCRSEPAQLTQYLQIARRTKLKAV